MRNYARLREARCAEWPEACLKEMNSDIKTDSQSVGAADVVEHLREIEHRLAVAWVENDRSVIEKVLADDWSVIDLTGRILTKADVLEEATKQLPAATSQRMFTSTNQSNLKMQSLLAKLGYEPSGVIHNLDEGDPELVYFCLLFKLLQWRNRRALLRRQK